MSNRERPDKSGIGTIEDIWSADARDDAARRHAPKSRSTDDVRGALQNETGLGTIEELSRSAAASPSAASTTLTDDVYASIAERLLDLCPLETTARAFLDDLGVRAEAEADRWGELPTDAGPVLDLLRAEFTLEQLADAGIVHRGDDGTCDPTRFATPAHRLLIPWRAEGVSGAISALQGRLLCPPREERGRRFVMPPGRRSVAAPYGAGNARELLGEGTGVAFVEGALNVLALRRLYREARVDRVVVGLPSSKAWRASWAALATGRTAFLALDADASGDRMADRIKADCLAAGARAVVRSKARTSNDWISELRRRLTTEIA